jgi:RND family efflux transporter MFP subunit
MMNKRYAKRAAAIALAAATVLVLAGCTAKGSATKDSFRTEKISVGQIVREITITGVLAPNTTVNVYPKLSGLVKELPVDVGNKVAAGQLVALIDVKELAAQLGVADASIATVRDQAAQAKVAIQTAQLNLDLAQKDYDRSSALFDSKVVTQSQIDDAKAKLDLAKAALDNAQHQYQTVSGSSLGQAQAQSNLIRVQISNSEIASPITGTVTNRNINLGELCTPSTALMTIADTVNLRLHGTLSQNDILVIKEGIKVRVSVDGMAGPGYEGVIAQIGPVAAATGQYFPVEIRVGNDGRLLAGMTAKASLSVSSAEGPLVPLAAIEQLGADTVAFVIEDGRASERKLTLGPRDAAQALVLSGLAQGDIVATSGVAALQDGAEVRR